MDFSPTTAFATGIRIGAPGAAGAGVSFDSTYSQHVSSQSRHVMFA